MITVNEIINKLKSNNSSLFKEEVLREHKEHEILREVLLLTYSPIYKFGLKKDVNFTKDRKFPKVDEYLKDFKEINLSNALKIVKDTISTRIFTGDSAVYLADKILESLNDSDKEIIIGVFRETQNIGCDTKTINKAFDGKFIKKTPYMGCVPYDTKKLHNLFEKYDLIYSQIKADGRYLSPLVFSDMINFESRQGKTDYFPNRFNDLMKFSDYIGFPMSLSSELIIPSIPDRQKANGILTSMNNIGKKLSEGKDIGQDLESFFESTGKRYEDLLDTLKLICWDFIPIEVYREHSEWAVIYQERFERIGEAIDKLNDKSMIELPETNIVKNASEALEHYKDSVLRGEEGTVVKGNDIWVDRKPVWQIKIKPEFTLDLRIKEFHYGDKNKKNKDVISSITCESEDGKLVTRATNMTEKMMKWVTENQDILMNTIMEVQCNGISKPIGSNTYACMYPSVISFRMGDKDIADTLEQCLAHMEAAIEAAKIAKKRK